MPWRVAQVDACLGFCLEVTFMDGVNGIVDMSKMIFSNHAGVFAALRDPALFDQVYVEYGAVTWPGALDLAPDTMYEQIKKQGKWVLN